MCIRDRDYTVDITTSTGLVANATAGVQVLVREGRAELLGEAAVGHLYRVVDGIGRLVAEGRIRTDRTTILASGAPAGAYQVLVMGDGRDPVVLRFILTGE